MNTKPRKTKLITLILDKTPYTPESVLRQRLEAKLAVRLSETDIYILALAVGVTSGLVSIKIK